ncbi:MAG TPA: hypothetical protein DHW78_00375 [Ruminococcaceae bacterium]|nr:hypothetical protein [Oscillospiraceae bacterium]HCM22769.1 hypothetical protein [Oscillospiraceae bacterium]
MFRDKAGHMCKLVNVKPDGILTADSRKGPGAAYHSAGARIQFLVVCLSLQLSGAFEGSRI